jgi:hypothetical protein
MDRLPNLRQFILAHIALQNIHGLFVVNPTATGSAGQPPNKKEEISPLSFPYFTLRSLRPLR